MARSELRHRLLRGIAFSDRGVAWIAIAAAITLFFFRTRTFFPNAHGVIGEDYGWFLPMLMAGAFWFAQNGILAVPYFTPAFCGGMPLLANPQSVIYSLPQLLLVAFDPLNAVLATLVIATMIGAIGTYLLAVRCFRTSPQAAALVSILFVHNGFLFYRGVIGHLTYHAFALAPIAALVVSGQHRALVPARHSVARTISSGLLFGWCVAYLTYAGALNFQIPFVLAVTLVVLMVQLRCGFDRAPWLTLVAGCVCGVLFSLMKLVPAVVLASQFPRAYLRAYLFHNPVEFVLVLFSSFFTPGSLPDVVSGAGSLGRHEFEFGLSAVPLLLLGGALMMRGGGEVFSALRRHPYSGILFAGVWCIPLALTFEVGDWGAVLLRIPVINNNTHFVRWWAIYLLPIMLAAGLAFDRVTASSQRWRSVALVAAMVLIGVQQTAHTPDYYSRYETTFDPAPILTAFRDLHQGQRIPAIETVGPSPASQTTWRSFGYNSAMLIGQSSWPCYEPLFGYRLELAPPLSLVEGPITIVNDDSLNLVDPAAYFQPGAARRWRFAATETASARQFAEYRAYAWNIPWWQRAATWGTLVSSVLSLGWFATRISRHV
jgi:hypothetical protein